MTSVSTSSSSGGTGSSSSSSSSSAAGGYDSYDSYGNYETYYDETTALPDGDSSKRVTISTDAGAKLDLELEGKIDQEAGTGMRVSTSGVGTSIVITRNKTKLVSEIAASSPASVDR